MQTLSFSSFKPITLLGDFASQYNRNCLLVTAKTEIINNFKQIQSKQINLKIPEENLALEIKQSTPVIKSNNLIFAKKIAQLYHAIFATLNTEFGLSILIENTSKQNPEVIIANATVNLLRAIALFQNFKISKRQLWENSRQLWQNLKINTPLYYLAGAVWQKPFFISLENQEYKIEICKLDKNNPFYLCQINNANLDESFGKSLDFFKQNQDKYESNLKAIEKLANLGLGYWQSQNWTNLGNLMNRSQKRFQELALVSDDLHKLCVKANLLGAMGAKICQDIPNGIIALFKQDVEQKLQKEGISFRII